MEGKVYAMYFSPTHTTGKITTAVAGCLAAKMEREEEKIDLTLPAGRQGRLSFGKEDILVFGFPVYGSRMPALLAGVLGGMRGNDTQAIPIAVYGNRDYDDALLEASDLLRENGFKVAAAGAFIGEHSYSSKVGTKRPDAKDMQLATEFALKIADKLMKGGCGEVEVKGNRPYKDAMPDMRLAPKTNENCTDCMICAGNCPVGIISEADPRIVEGGCIRCCACIKFCPEDAKYFEDEHMAKVVAYLETNFTARREPECML